MGVEIIMIKQGSALPAEHFSTPMKRLALLFVISCFAAFSAHAQTYTVLYEFTGIPDKDGAGPVAPLLLDASGNLYGTTQQGGSSSCGNGGCGTIFKLDSAGNETILHFFHSLAGGQDPASDLIQDAKGNLYSTTRAGGAAKPYGMGTVFRLAPDGDLVTMYNFGGGGNGAAPSGGLLRDAEGNLYGGSSSGGINMCGTATCGILLKLTAQGALTVLHSFDNTDGVGLSGDLIRDRAGNFFGNAGNTLFKMDSTGTLITIYTFQNLLASPGIAMDSAGNFYGTTELGGTGGFGEVFKVDPAGSLTVLYNFQGKSDGGEPFGRLLLDKSGNIYGTTVLFGQVPCDPAHPNTYPQGCGTVFKLDKAGNYTVLHTFTGPGDGAGPYAGLISDAAGNLYGTTVGGGNIGTTRLCESGGCGVVFKITP